MPGIANFEFVPGRDFVRELTLRSNGALLDLTGYTAKIQIRSEKRTTAPLFYTMSTANGKIVITPGAVERQIKLIIPNADSADFTWALGYYDLTIISPAPQDLCVLTGVFISNPQPTVLP